MRVKYGIALDQHGNKFHFGKHCRKHLSEQITGKVSKMYQDKHDGTIVQVGYVIGKHWLRVYAPAEEAA